MVKVCGRMGRRIRRCEARARARRRAKLKELEIGADDAVGAWGVVVTKKNTHGTRGAVRVASWARRTASRSRSIPESRGVRNVLKCHMRDQFRRIRHYKRYLRHVRRFRRLLLAFGWMVVFQKKVKRWLYRPIGYRGRDDPGGPLARRARDRFNEMVHAVVSSR